MFSKCPCVSTSFKPLKTQNSDWMSREDRSSTTFCGRGSWRHIVSNWTKNHRQFGRITFGRSIFGQIVFGQIIFGWVTFGCIRFCPITFCPITFNPIIFDWLKSDWMKFNCKKINWTRGQERNQIRFGRFLLMVNGNWNEAYFWWKFHLIKKSYPILIDNN